MKWILSEKAQLLSKMFIATVLLFGSSYAFAEPRYEKFKAACESLNGDFQGDTLVTGDETSTDAAYLVPGTKSPVGAAKCSMHSEKWKWTLEDVQFRSHKMSFFRLTPVQTFDLKMIKFLQEACDQPIRLAAYSEIAVPQANKDGKMGASLSVVCP